MSVTEKAQEIAKEFVLTDDTLNACVEHFIWATEHGLRHHTDLGMPMIPTFVTGVPNGKEKGTFLAADLGGTNFRVCSVTLKGDSTYDLVQNKNVVPKSLMSGNTKEFMEFLADKLGEFLKKHHENELKDNKDKFKMGFTFSFPVDQTGYNKGKLIRWTKGFDIKDLVDQDVCEKFQQAIDEKGLPVRVAALVNDTVGTLMSRSYTKAESGKTLIGCIFGTGTNGAYSEKIKNIPKFDINRYPEIKGEKLMVINTEWGSFDNRLKYLPNTKYDQALNEKTPNVGYHMFEKRVSGMFLGELLRLCMVDLQQKGVLFSQDDIIETNDALSRPWSLDTSVPSNIDGDVTDTLIETDGIIKTMLGYQTTLEQRKAIQILAKAIGKRSAYLSAVPLAGLILHTKAVEKFEGEIDVGADGSVVEHYPNFEQMIREALRKTKVGDDEKRVTLGLARDGSGVGAALCALVAP